MPRRVVSLWLPDFATDRLTRAGLPLAPWRGRPLATVTERHGATAVAAVNAAARAGGVAPGQPLAEVRARCPGLRTVVSDPEDEVAALRRLALWCDRWSPVAAVDALGEDGAAGLWIDASGCAHLFGGEEALLKDMVGRLDAAGYHAFAAVADTPGAAWAAVRFAMPRGKRTMAVPAGVGRQWLGGLPAAALRLPAATLATLDRLGLRRVGDLMTLPRGPLAARFGTILPLRLDQLAGTVAEPIVPERAPPPFRVRLAFAEPIGRGEDVKAALERLLESLCALLERERQGARRLTLTLFRIDGSLVEATVGTSRASRDSRHLARLFAERLDGLDAGFGIEVMVLAAVESGALPAGQGDLEAAPGRAEDALGLLVDRLVLRLGAGAVTRQAPRASHLPERSVVPAAPIGAMPGDPPPEWLPRPLRLLRRPEMVEAEAAPPEATAGAGAPSSFRHGGRTHRLLRAEGPERIAPEWWRVADTVGAAPSAAFRDYWRVEDEAGRRFWLFSQGARWFLHGYFA